MNSKYKKKRKKEDLMKKLSFFAVALLAISTMPTKAETMQASNLTTLEITIKTLREALNTLTEVRDHQKALEEANEVAEKMRDSQSNSSPADRKPIEDFHRDASFYSSRSTGMIRNLEHAANNIKTLADKVNSDSFAGTKTVQHRRKRATSELESKQKNLAQTVKIAKGASEIAD